MKKIVLCVLLCAVVFEGQYLTGAEERPLIGSNSAVMIQYQIKSSNFKSWSVSSASLRGAVSESMIENALLQRHPGSQIRVLSVSNGEKVQIFVRYQISRDGKTWTMGTATLQNALTESMARNQLSVRYPGMQIRILGIRTR